MLPEKPFNSLSIEQVATDLFKAWFYEHLEDPFPSDEIKADFADRTGLSFTQVRIKSA